MPCSAGILVADGVDRRPGAADGLLAVAERHGALRLVGAEVREVDRFGVRPEQLLGEVEVPPGVLGPPLGHQDVAAQQVGAGEVQGVVGDGEQRDRPADVVERGGGRALDVVQAWRATSRGGRASTRR